MKKTVYLDGLECASCANKMERAIAKLEGVHMININFATTKLVIEADEDQMNTILSQAKTIIKKLEPDTEMIEK